MSGVIFKVKTSIAIPFSLTGGCAFPFLDILWMHFARQNASWPVGGNFLAYAWQSAKEKKEMGIRTGWIRIDHA